MLVLKCSMKLQMLEKMLRWSFPESLKVYGAVMNINRGNPFRNEVVVDSWPDFKAVITRPQKEVDGCGFFIFVSKRSTACGVKSLACCLEQPALLGQQRRSWHRTWTIPSWHFLPNTLSVLSLRMDPKLKLACLDISHASLLSKTWSRGGNPRSQKYLANLICCFPSVCVLDDNGYPLSWSLTDQFSTMIHGYTLPEHRRKGYSRLVATTLAKKLHSCGFPAQG
ncbi:GLYL3 protein, partial [Arenaria interpres]|nr:GLYL3 protein [Arenaria interpres]